MGEGCGLTFMSALPTVRVVNPAAPDEFMIVNESDLGDHELWQDEAGASAQAIETRVGKGPRGKWYVWHGRDRFAGPFDDEAAALAEMDRLR